MAGIDLTSVKELLGHKSLTMTLRYLHLTPGHKRKAVHVLDRLMEKNEDEALKNGYNLDTISEKTHTPENVSHWERKCALKESNLRPTD